MTGIRREEPCGRNRRLWLAGAVLFAAGVVLQIEVRRRAVDHVPGGYGPPGNARVAPVMPSEPAPRAARVSSRPGTVTTTSSGEAAAGEKAPAASVFPSTTADEREVVRLERRLETMAQAERLPADWADVLEELAPPGTPGTAARLRSLVRNHRDPEVAQQVLRALERLGGSASVRALYEIGMEHEHLAADSAVRLSRVRGRASAPALLEIIRDSAAPEAFVAAALRSLGHSALRQPVDEIRVIAVDGERTRTVRVAAVEALGWIADPVALSDLLPLLESPDRPVRRQAIRSVGRIRDPRSIDALEKLAEAGPNEQERLMAREALARLRGESLRRR